MTCPIAFGSTDLGADGCALCFEFWKMHADFAYHVDFATVPMTERHLPAARGVRYALHSAVPAHHPGGNIHVYRGYVSLKVGQRKERRRFSFLLGIADADCDQAVPDGEFEYHVVQFARAVYHEHAHDISSTTLELAASRLSNLLLCQEIRKHIETHNDPETITATLGSTKRDTGLQYQFDHEDKICSRMFAVRV